MDEMLNNAEPTQQSSREEIKSEPTKKKKRHTSCVESLRNVTGKPLGSRRPEHTIYHQMPITIYGHIYSKATLTGDHGV